MLTPSEGQEIYERVMRELDGGRDMTPEDVAHLMQAAESGHAPAQNAYANVLNNVEGNLLAALPWYCKAAQQGHSEAQTTLRELYAAETLVREQVGKYLSVEQLIALRKRKVESNDPGSANHAEPALVILWGIVVALTAGIALSFDKNDHARMLVVLAGMAVGLLLDFLYKRLR